MENKVKINEIQLKKIISESIESVLSSYYQDEDTETAKALGLIGKNIVFKFKDGRGTTGFRVDDIQAQRDGWILRANRNDGRRLKVRDIIGLLNGKSPLPYGTLYSEDGNKEIGFVGIAD